MIQIILAFLPLLLLLFPYDHLEVIKLPSNKINKYMQACNSESVLSANACRDDSTDVKTQTLYCSQNLSMPMEGHLKICKASHFP